MSLNIFGDSFVAENHQLIESPVQINLNKIIFFNSLAKIKVMFSFILNRESYIRYVSQVIFIFWSTKKRKKKLQLEVINYYNWKEIENIDEFGNNSNNECIK